MKKLVLIAAVALLFVGCNKPAENNATEANVTVETNTTVTETNMTSPEANTTVTETNTTVTETNTTEANATAN